MLGPNQRAYIEFKKEQTAQKAKQKPSKPYVYKPRPGYLYIIHCTGFPYYKIGHTTQAVKARLDGLQTGVPFELTIEYALQVKDIYEAEQQVHQRHKDKRIRGEWFMLTDAELDVVKGDMVSSKDYVLGVAHTPT